VNGPSQGGVELFLQESSEHLQYLREYSGLLQEAQARPEDIEKLYISAHSLAGTSASYGYPHFSEVAAKMAHIFHYAMNTTLGAEMLGPLTEFISGAISVLEFDLLQISSSGQETIEDISEFKQRHAFAFPAPPSQESAGTSEPQGTQASQGYEREPASAPSPQAFFAPPVVSELPEDTEVPAEVLEFFLPEAEEHFQTITECLLVLESHPNPEDINRLFRSIHTIKGSAAQVGLHRLAAIAHRVEDLIGCLRDGTTASLRVAHRSLPSDSRCPEEVPPSSMAKPPGNGNRRQSADGANRSTHARGRHRTRCQESPVTPAGAARAETPAAAPTEPVHAVRRRIPCHNRTRCASRSNASTA
jgi:chemotaxis protein histidine kinase CheA